jgi:hypothetical protein
MGTFGIRNLIVLYKCLGFMDFWILIRYLPECGCGWRMKVVGEWPDNGRLPHPYGVIDLFCDVLLLLGKYLR